MVSTALDYARFCQFLLNKGQLDGVRLLSRTTVEYMASDHIPASVRVNNFPFPIIDTKGDNGQSFGWVGIYGPSFVVDPKEQMFAIFLVQNLNAAWRNAYWNLMRVLPYQAVVD